MGEYLSNKIKSITLTLLDELAVFWLYDKVYRIYENSTVQKRLNFLTSQLKSLRKAIYEKSQKLWQLIKPHIFKFIEYSNKVIGGFFQTTFKTLTTSLPVLIGAIFVIPVLALYYFFAAALLMLNGFKLFCSLIITPCVKFEALVEAFSETIIQLYVILEILLSFTTTSIFKILKTSTFKLITLNKALLLSTWKIFKLAGNVIKVSATVFSKSLTVPIKLFFNGVITICVFTEKIVLEFSGILENIAKIITEICIILFNVLNETKIYISRGFIKGAMSSALVIIFITITINDEHDTSALTKPIIVDFAKVQDDFKIRGTEDSSQLFASLENIEPVQIKAQPEKPEKIKAIKKPKVEKKLKVKKKKQKKVSDYKKHLTPPDIIKVKVNSKLLTLTFDGGAEANEAKFILDTLRKNSIKTTFFIAGTFIKNYPNLVLTMIADGHEVANHSLTHPHLTSFSKSKKHNTLSHVNEEYIAKQLNETNKLFKNLTGRNLAPFWRAPYGEINDEIRYWAYKAGYMHVNWTRGAGHEESLDTLDWVSDKDSHLYLSSSEIAQKIFDYEMTGKNLSGGIVLMHLGTNRKTDKASSSLNYIISVLKSMGYNFATVSSMLKSDKKYAIYLQGYEKLALTTSKNTSNKN